MTNPAKLVNASADTRIPGLPQLPAGTARQTLLVPAYDPATDDTYQTGLLPGDGVITSNQVVGGPKLVQYLDSHFYGVPAGALTLDRLDPDTIVPGTVATVDNPSPTPLATTQPPAQYVATRSSASASGAVLVPAYIGAAPGDTVAVIWTQAAVGGAGAYTAGVGIDITGSVISLSSARATGTVLHLDNLLGNFYPNISTGSFTVDLASAVPRATAFVTLEAGASAPALTPVAPGSVPAAGDFVRMGGSHKAGKRNLYSFCYAADGSVLYYISQL